MSCKADILAELETLYGMEIRQPGDIDRNDIAEQLGVDPRSANNIMERYCKRELYTEHKVRGPNGHAITVWRKVTTQSKPDA